MSEGKEQGFYNPFFCLTNGRTDQMNSTISHGKGHDETLFPLEALNITTNFLRVKPNVYANKSQRITLPFMIEKRESTPECRKNSTHGQH